MNTINSSNLRQAATAISQYCNKHSKGKAKQGAVVEALSHFLGFKNSNVALADVNKNKPDIAYIFTFKGIPTIHLNAQLMVADLVDELIKEDIDLSDIDYSSKFKDKGSLEILTFDNGQRYVVDNVEHPYISIHPIEIGSSPDISISSDHNEALNSGDYNDLLNIVGDLIQKKKLTVEKSPYMDSLITAMLEDNPDDDIHDVARAIAVNLDLVNTVSMDTAIGIYNDVIEMGNNGSPYIQSPILDSLKSTVSDLEPFRVQEHWREKEDEVVNLIRARMDVNVTGNDIETFKDKTSGELKIESLKSMTKLK
ncbi:MAG: hypothetical protein QM500_19605 [Methylococcales bacterium]